MHMYTLKNAQKTQTKLADELKKADQISHRPLFHFATPGGWCNDPNGFSEFKECIHLFYQYHPYSTHWGPMHWGHATSKNMLEWNLAKVALAPDSDADFKGCFSGTGLQDGDSHVLVYTGVTNNGKVDVQNQCLAFGDGTDYKKFESNPVVTSKMIPFEFNMEHFRDPKIFAKDGKYFMICVIKQLNGFGAMVMFQSDNLKTWSYKGMIDSSKDGLSNMWECPDFFTLDGKDFLIFSPQEVKENSELGFHDGNNSVYVSGFLDFEKCEFIREKRIENNYTAAPIDYGIDFYAPETTRLSDGRTIMIGWMQSWESYITPKEYVWSGMMTLPRELHFKDNRLYQMPIRELEDWKNLEKSSSLDFGDEIILFKNQQRHFELDFEISSESLEGFSSLLICNHNGEQVKLNFNFTEKTISFDRTKSLTPGTIQSRTVKIPIEGKKLKAKIICDTCSLEIFIDDGKLAFTNTFFFTDAESDLIFKNDTSKKIDYTFYKIQKNHFD